MAISIIAFSLMHLCVKFIPNVPVHQIVTFRSFFSIILTVFVLKQNAINPWGNKKGLLVLRGVVGVGSLFAFFYAIKLLPLATAITISNLIPFFILIFAAIILKEKILSIQWLVFLMMIFGVVMIKGFDYRVSTIGVIVALTGAFFAALAHFLVRYLRSTENSWVIIFYFPLISLIVVAPFTFLNWYKPQLEEWLYLIAIGITTHIGQIFLTKSYQKSEVKAVSGMYYLGILLSLVYGYVFFEETYNFVTLIGMFVIVVGVSFNYYLTRKK